VKNGVKEKDIKFNGDPPKLLLGLFDTPLAISWASFALMAFYLHKTLQGDLIPMFDYSEYTLQVNCMLLNGTTISTLDLIEIKGLHSSKKEGSLFGQLDYTGTSFGRRKLQRWICAPLYDIGRIRSRQDSVEDLVNHPESVKSFLDYMAAMPDLERLICSVYKESHNFSSESLPFQKLKEFYQLVANIKSAKQAIAIFSHVSNEFKSDRLKALVQIKGQDSQEGIFPDIDKAISEFEALIKWKQVAQYDIVPEPVSGFDDDYDRVKAQNEQLQKELQAYLSDVREQLGNRRNYNINYVQSRYVYEIEVPKDLVEGSKRPKDFELSSQRIGYLRFVSPYLKNLTEEIEKARKATVKSLVPFMKSIFSQFRKKKHIWNQVVSCLAELDCLCSLAQYAINQSEKMCRPELIESSG